MTDILTLVFRTFMSEASQKKKEKVGGFSPAACSSLVVGDRDVSRSLLLLAAVTAASETGMRVVFFTQTQIQSLPVSLQRCVPSLSPESLKKIKFSYPRTLEELLQQVASLHESSNTNPAPPSLIIVDRLECFLRDGRGSSRHREFRPAEQSCAAHLSALLCDTAAFLTNLLEMRSSSSGPCCLLASFLSEEEAVQAGGDPSATDQTLDILDRYFLSRCTLDPDRSYEAAAAGAQEVWNIYLSGRGITSSTKDCEEEKAGVAQEWQLYMFPDGLMEFKLL